MVLKWRKINESWVCEGDRRLVVARALTRYYVVEIDRPYGDKPGAYFWSAVPHGNTWQNMQEGSEVLYDTIPEAIKAAEAWLQLGIAPMWGEDSYTPYPNLPIA